eukprot:CAMPEP_0119503502 /NCGR_PEP_ID=MMETSP1344-20130328/24653_1 /TAXON_ID=236787 /ORGANISM="Florenciella parvula, Strain CCMP2471" /LENGTH=32 /DNA_ID= /DNA_START= /DNA_END= /DNA_ORIENTATION=
MAPAIRPAGMELATPALHGNGARLPPMGRSLR